MRGVQAEEGAYMALTGFTAV